MPSVGDLIISRLVDPIGGVIENVYYTPPASGEFVLGMDSAGVPTCFKDANPTSNGLMTAAGMSSLAAMASASAAKRRETYSGTSAATTGAYSVTFGTPFSVAPNIQANIINPSDTQSLKITAVSAAGFTVVARNRTDVVGLLPSFSNASGLAIDVLVTEK